MPADRQVSRIVSVAAGALAVAASVLPPAIYLSLSYEREVGNVEAEAELTSQLITPIVSANPDLWRFEQVRLSEYLARRPRRGVPETRRVLDLDGQVVAESVDPLRRPRVTSSLPLLDAGERVGTIEISRSLWKVVYHAAFFALLLVPVAFLAFQVLRTVPLRAIRNRERALRRQRDNAQRYLDVAAVAVVVVDASGRVSLVNRKGAEILGRDVDDVVGKRWVEGFVEPASRERVANELAVAFPSRRVHTLEYAVVRPSGERRTLSWQVTPITPREGGPPRLLASGMDVTAERQLEQQLRHAQKMEALGELASDAARGFDDILSAVKGYAAQLRKELPPGDAHLAHVDEILAAADRGATLTRSLVTFSQETAVSPEPADVGEIVRRAERLLRSLVHEGVELRAAAPETPLRALVDPHQLEQVLVGLVTNARDAMPNGGRIVVSTARAELDAEGARRAGVERTGAYVRVSVADTGVGIAPEVQARVFEPFFTTKPLGKGTGLGLSTAYAVMKQHHGAIAVESEPGKGATFSFFLPLLVEEATASPSAGGTAPAGAAPPAHEATPSGRAARR